MPRTQSACRGTRLEQISYFNTNAPKLCYGCICVVGCIFDLEVIITLQIIFFSKNIFKETLNKSRLKTVCTSCLHIFRKLAQKISKIMRQHYCGLFVQSDKKSAGAICTNDLISVSLIFQEY